MDIYYKKLLSKIKDCVDVESILKISRELCRVYSIGKLPSIVQILLAAKGEQRKKLFTILRSKPSRALSGISVVAIMSKPSKCPHGKCSICPGGPDSEFGNVPQSYTGNEPATMRARRNDYHPYLQVFDRLHQYVLMGQVPNKIELIIMGGTFNAQDLEYQEWFVANSLKAMNDFGNMFLPKGIDFERFITFFELDEKNEMTEIREKKVKKKMYSLIEENISLEKEQELNESSNMRCVALCLETRPDYCKIENIKHMLKLGVTRVELGVQSVYDYILKNINRGHVVYHSVEATRLLKDSGLKVVYHILLGAPGYSCRKEIKMFKYLFNKKDFKPDGLKIYPCMVMKGTELFNQWKAGKFQPLNTETAAKLIAEIKARYIPSYCRIMRIQRDISSKVVSAGVDKTNLRQYIEEILLKKNKRCKCIRCREAGRVEEIKGEPKFLEKKYKASKGMEYFLSLETENALLGFLRLRFPFRPFINELKDCALVRELHVYGESTELGKIGKVQHLGYGKELMKKAEELAIKNKYKKLAVISGIGVREYYRKLGYQREGFYMIKDLAKNHL
ncbi:tRNA uridine(34) 5-carboxymethylaminomethyl modification radical SAM/GNAT enzyme Elp3 [Candidatus Woesearchaeota archaeon]|nr:tRNA uridine(34) 5-carboxymethylaminomethyl modification radical SAM/GNAT enzyme Elp3 [Candidatus Woesearchaeota archaeon]